MERRWMGLAAAGLLGALVGGIAGPDAGGTAAGDTRLLASRTTDTGTDYSWFFDMSADGSSVVVESVASFLPGVPSDAARTWQIDVPTGTARLLDSSSPFIPFGLSADGRWLAAMSLQDHGTLVVVDTVTGARTALGNWGYMHSGEISDDGSTIVLTGSQTGNFASTFQLYTIDRVSGAVTQITTGDDHSFHPHPNADGSVIAFSSYARNLAGGNVNGSDVIVWERSTGTFSLASAAPGGAAANDQSVAADVTPDGRHVLFNSWATNLAPGKVAGGQMDAFLLDRSTGALEIVSRGFDDQPAGATGAAVSPDGRQVLISGAAANLEAGTNFATQAYVRDRSLQQTVLATASSAGEAAGTGIVTNAGLAISADFRTFVFASGASNLGAAPDIAGDLFVRELHGSDLGASAPSVVGVPDRVNDSAGWYRAPVTIDWRAATLDGSAASDPADTLAALEGVSTYRSAPSCSASGCATGVITVAIDTQPPTVEILPNRDAATSVVARIVDTGSGASQSDVVIDGQACQGRFGGFSCETVQRSLGLTEVIDRFAGVGEHTISVTPRDTAGNVGATVMGSFWVDLDDPVVTIPTGQSGRRGAQLVASVSDPTSGIDTVSAALGGTALAVTGPDAAGNISVTIPPAAPIGAGELSVTATDRAGRSTTSTQAITVLAAPPSTPQTVALAAQDQRLRLTWTAPASDGGSPIIGYDVTISGQAGVIRLPANRVAYLVTGLANGTDYTASIAAVNAAGPSNQVSVAGRPRPTASVFADVAVAEGNAGLRTLQVTLQLSNPSTVPMTVSWRTVGGTATTANRDFVNVPITPITIAPGATSATVSVQVRGDRAVEPNETFDVRFSAPTGLVLADNIALITITNDD
jgi:Fibronectin type III domain/Calx-beta domain